MSLKLKNYDIVNKLGKVFQVCLIHMEGGGNDKLAILLPGMGYTVQKPLFDYATKLLIEKGYDVLQVQYDYRAKEYDDLTENAFYDYFRFDVKAALDQVLDDLAYGKYLVVGKSLGTLAMADELPKRDVFRKAQAVWLTPLIHKSRVFEVMMAAGQTSLTIIGSADSCYTADRWEELSSRDTFDTLLIEDANHSLEIPGDTYASIDVLKQTITKLDEWLG